jgi:hypothetical protein
MEQGEVEAARATYETATQLTPECILRLQHTGTLNFYSGEPARATELLERAWTIGKRSRLFDYLTMLLLVFIRFDKRQTSGLEIALENLSKVASNHTQSVRLRRFERISKAMWEVSTGHSEKGFAIAREVSSDSMRPAFDMEAAMNVLSMLARLVGKGFPMDEFESIVCRIARRFAVSKAASQVLLKAALERPDVEEWLSNSLAETSKIAQKGIDMSLDAKVEEAIEMLLRNGEVSFNSRIIELAGQLLKRHRGKLDSADRLIDRQGVLARRFCIPSTHIAGIRRSGRSSGGLLLRT